MVVCNCSPSTMEADTGHRKRLVCYSLTYTRVGGKGEVEMEPADIITLNPSLSTVSKTRSS